MKWKNSTNVFMRSWQCQSLLFANSIGLWKQHKILITKRVNFAWFHIIQNFSEPLARRNFIFPKSRNFIFQRRFLISHLCLELDIISNLQHKYFTLFSKKTQTISKLICFSFFSRQNKESGMQIMESTCHQKYSHSIAVLCLLLATDRCKFYISYVKSNWRDLQNGFWQRLRIEMILTLDIKRMTINRHQVMAGIIKIRNEPLNYFFVSQKYSMSHFTMSRFKMIIKEIEHQIIFFR